MKELEETNCEISNIINFELPSWDPSNNFASQNELVTIDGSKESNVNRSGGFLNADCKYAWISYETHLVVIDVRYGKFISSWNFPNKITSVSSFPNEPGQVPLLLVGLDNNAIRIKDSIGYLCIFDCCTSTILTTIEVPAGVEKACIIHGGAEWEEFNEKRPDTVLSGNTGLIFAALRNLQHVVIDINRPSWENFLYEGKSITAKLEFVNNSSTWSNSINKTKKESTHLAYDLIDKEIEQYIGFDRTDFEATPLFDENLCSVLLSSVKIGCLITGCLGRVIIWQHDGSKVWISPSFDENAYVTHVALLEPSDDPRPFYYLWIACQSDSPESSAVLRMYAMLFNKKHCDKAGESSLYFNLESQPSLKFELELEQGERVHSLLSVERENLRDPSDTSSRRGEDSLLLIGSDERLLMFDLNRWYKEQMPRTMAECRNPNSVMSSYRTKAEDCKKRAVLACSYVPRSLREFPTKGPSSPEELFYPNSLTLEWIELAADNLTFWLARGVQSELLRDITIAGPIVIVKPAETYRRCLVAGLVPFDSSPPDQMLDVDGPQQREMLLSLCLEQRWANFLIRCATEWSDGSAVYLYPEFLRWGVQRASELKQIADRLCVPLFDQSGTNIGECEVKTLRFCCQQLECLTTVVSRLPNIESDLEKQRRALKRISTYLQVLLWFYDVGLLPETQEVEEDDVPHITLSNKIPYPREKLMEIYKKKRKSDENNEGKVEEKLFIHQLISHDCLPIRYQWEREAGNECLDYGGHYPPPSLQSLLRCYLTDCYREEDDNAGDDDDECDMAEMDNKHSITIYLLMDLAMLLQGSYPSVDRLIKYPSAFKLTPSLIKLTQAFWLLDHDDYEGFFKIMTGQLILISDIKDWHHKIAVNILLRNNEHKLALMYLRVLKPPLSSLEDQSTMIGLAVERDLVESAFYSRPPSHYAQLLTKFFQSCKTHGKLKEILHLSLDYEEEEAFVRFLKEGGCEDTRLLYFLQRCRHTEASDIFACDTALNSHRPDATAKAIHPTALKILSAFNATLPEITKRFASSLVKNNANFTNEDFHHRQQLSAFSGLKFSSGSYYPRPMSHCRNAVNGIFDVAMNKTRETCLKSERGLAGANHIPFLGAPCSTITYCTRTNTAGAAAEQSEANCVIFPERKMAKGKRTRGMMNESEDNSDDKEEKKRRKLCTEVDASCSIGPCNNERPPRRLSMSQVCDTPLVQRKARLDNMDSSRLVTETPHSILKIRQMLRRNSSSPGLSGNNDSQSETEGVLQQSISGDGRSARQIRFSLDRFSATDDSIFSVNDCNQEQTEKENSKDTDECAEESYYSPSMSVKSLRDASVLSDNSFTKYIRGLRPRPSLRRSSLFSRASTESQSQKTNFSDTIDVSALDASFEGNRKISNISQKSSSPISLYAASVLSPNTSIIGLPMKRPFALNNNEDNDDDVTEESGEESEDDVVANLSDQDIDKESLVTPLLHTVAQREEEKMNEKEANDELIGDEMEIQDEEEINQERLISASCNLHEDDELSEDVQSEEIELEREREASLEIEKDFREEEEGEEEEENEEEVECDQDDDTFQSLSNSVDYTVNTPSDFTSNCLDQPDDNCESSYINNEVSCDYSNQEYKLAENLVLPTKSQQFNEPSYVDYHQNILTRPIFIDSQGIVKYDSACDITDDESIDDDYASVAQPEAKERGSELSINLTTSDGCENIKKQAIKNRKSNGSSFTEDDEGNGSGKAASFISLSSDSLQSSDFTNTALKMPEINKESSLNLQLRTAIDSDNFDNERNPLKGVSTKRTPIRYAMPSARRSIKSVSTSPVGKIDQLLEPTGRAEKVGRNERGTSEVTTEVKKILSKVISDPIVIISPLKESLLAERGKSSTDEQKSLVSDSPEKVVDEKSRISTESSELSQNNSSDFQRGGRDNLPAIEKKTNKSMSKRSTRTSQKDKSQASLADAIESSGQRVTRTGSIIKDSEKPAKKTRATSISKEPIPAKSNVKNDNIIERVTEKKIGKSRATKATSMAKEITTKLTSVDEDTKAEVPEDEIQEVCNERARRANTSRVSSLAKDTKERASAAIRKTRSASTGQNDDDDDSMSLRGRRTRASSLVKGSSAIEEKSAPTRRMTRASSLAKELSSAEQDESFTKRPTRKRGSSVPKDITIGSEHTKLKSRNRRSNSLLKEVILEESFSYLDSSASARRSKMPRTAGDGVESSPAANTRSRRSSIQSVPEDLEEALGGRSINTEADESRARRAVSVDSCLVVPPGKRMTRSVLAKATVIPEAIPEEVGVTKPASKRQPGRRKRTTSVSSDTTEPGDASFKAKASGKPPRKGRKNSESRDFLFSLPEEAGHLTSNAEDECRTPTYTFSEPTELQKFISAIRDDEESSDMTTNLSRRNTNDSKDTSLVRIQRRQRTCYILPKNTNNKAT